MNEKRITLWAIAVVMAMFVALVFAQAGKKFALDEVDFPVLAQAISETGKPYHYRGESDPSSLGLWHPPLYAYSLAGFVKAFGFSENTVRTFGVLCTLATAFMTVLIYRELFQVVGAAASRFALLFLPLFLLHPYTIANTTVPDIDSTVLPITILAFIYGLVRMLNLSGTTAQPDWTTRRTLALASLFALNLWAKMTTPLVLIPAAFLMFKTKGWSWNRSIIISSAVAIGGALIFLTTYALYCYVLALPFDFTFRFLVFSFTKNSASGGGMAALFAGIYGHLVYTKQFVNWLGLMFVFVLALACGALIFQKSKQYADKILLVLAGFALFVTTFYLSLTGAFGGFFKYPYPVFSLLVLVMAHYLQKHLFNGQEESDVIRISHRETSIKIGQKQILLSIFIAATLAMGYYQLTVAKDIVTFQDRPVPFPTIILITATGLAIGMFFAKKTSSLWLTYGLVVLYGMLLGSQFGISRSQAVATYPTKYHYGQAGFDETVSYLHERLGAKEPIWSMKDIGHYANGTYFENYSSIFGSEPEITRNLQEAIKEKKVQYFVVTTGIGQDRVDAYAPFRSALDICCAVEKQFGNFIIYKAKQHE